MSSTSWAVPWLGQELLRQQNARNREAQELERLREDQRTAPGGDGGGGGGFRWITLKEKRSKGKLRLPRQTLHCTACNTRKTPANRKVLLKSDGLEQEERQQLMARYEEDNRLNQLSDQKRRIKMQEYRRAVDHQMEGGGWRQCELQERRKRYEAERQKEREELERMKAEEARQVEPRKCICTLLRGAEQARIVEEERQSLLGAEETAGDTGRSGRLMMADGWLPEETRAE
eukprot:Skav203122  [mRNA]  locus=scaffold447:668269:673992:- [translate_table: standard]